MRRRCTPNVPSLYDPNVTLMTDVNGYDELFISRLHPARLGRAEASENGPLGKFYDHLHSLTLAAALRMQSMVLAEKPQSRSAGRSPWSTTSAPCSHLRGEAPQQFQLNGLTVRTTNSHHRGFRSKTIINTRCRAMLFSPQHTATIPATSTNFNIGCKLGLAMPSTVRSVVMTVPINSRIVSELQ